MSDDDHWTFAKTTLDDLIATVRGRPPPPEVASFMVGIDVWEALKVAVPICRGGSLSVGAIQIRPDPWCPRGWIIPLDSKGLPLPKKMSGPDGSEEHG